MMLNIVKPILQANNNNKLLLLLPLILSDVSLRDGLQGLSKERQETFTLNEKKNIFHNILFNYKPKNIEIGSIVNAKKLPIMSDSLQLYDYIVDFMKKTKNDNTNIFIVVPNEKGFNIGISHGIKNYSFLTSVSNSFQKKNVNKTLKETKEELKRIFTRIKSTEFKTKLYISCINNCPLEGFIDNDLIVNEIINYHKELPNINEFCLSDTCGTLKYEDYKYIIDYCIYLGIHPSKLSLHLHIKIDNIKEIVKIIDYSLDNNINRFDVSIMESGGCSITMTESQLLPNMSYDLLFKILENYYTNKD